MLVFDDPSFIVISASLHRPGDLWPAAGLCQRVEVHGSHDRAGQTLAEQTLPLGPLMTGSDYKAPPPPTNKSGSE